MPIGGSAYSSDNNPAWRNYYRWDTSASEWKLNWNKDATPVNGGSSSIGGKRMNFDTDSNYFSGYSVFNLTDNVASANFSTGLTITAKTKADRKELSAYNSSWDNVESPNNPFSCIFEIYNPVSEQSIALVDVGDSNGTELLDRTNKANPVNLIIGVREPVTTVVRYSLTINPNGTDVNVYINGAQHSFQLDTAFALDSPLEITVGSRNRCDRVYVRNYGSNFKGEITNIQTFTNEWDSTKAFSDSVDPDGIVSPTGMVSRFLMDEDYQEGKPTHAGYESTPYGANISFPDGDMTLPSYIEGEFYVAVKNKYGILKDNVTTFDLNTGTTLTSEIINECTSPINGSSTIPSSPAVITEYAKWDDFIDEKDDTEYTSMSHGNVAFFTYNSSVAVAQSSLDSDWSVEWTMSAYNESGLTIRFGDVSTMDKTTISKDDDDLSRRWVINERVEGTIEHDDGILIDHTVVTGDKFRLEWIYSAQTISFQKLEGGSWVEVVESANMVVPSGTHMTALFALSINEYTSDNRISAINDVKVTHRCNNTVMAIGDKALHTGSYAYDYMFCRPYGIGAGVNMTVTANGTKLNIINTTVVNRGNLNGIGILGGNPEPDAGSCLFYPSSGLLQFNSADVGKEIEVLNSVVKNCGTSEPLGWYL